MVSRQQRSDGYVELNQLFETFKFETLEAGFQMDLEKRECSEMVIHFFNVQKVDKRISTEKNIYVYQGLTLKPLGAIVNPAENSFIYMNELSKYQGEHFKVISIDSNKAIFSLETVYTSNGNKVEKVITFNNNIQWSLKIGEKDIELESYGINDHFTLDENMQNVFTISKQIKVCCGVDVGKSTVCSRFHNVESWKNTDSDTSTRILRSVICLRVVKINARCVPDMQNLSENDYC
ncbi:hypothetical protein DPMN_072110 [Dreissena polymorpha]|uniref:Uncharacterized protein n=2 Tax=Dreissena polymorpha TaxID=45954 RepID=A0A9D3Z3W3_DREPO|nr:hypothetical protein DPMN_072110 [Dreissena polymorpha]